MASTTNFNDTLRFITSIKLQELEKQRRGYQSHTKPSPPTEPQTETDSPSEPPAPHALAKTNPTNDALVDQIETLVNTIKGWKGSGSTEAHKTLIDGKFTLNNIEYWLRQAHHDPAFSTDVLLGWLESLENHIKQLAMRFDCAKLFGELFNEWLASGDSSTAPGLDAGLDEDGAGKGEKKADVEVEEEEFVDVGRKEKVDQKERFSSIVFEEHPVDTKALRKYLEELFESPDATKALENVRSAISSYGALLVRSKMNTTNVQHAIRGLLSSGLMDEAKRATLKEFLGNSTIQSEVVSVLNMRLASLDTWAWPESGLVIEMRRHLNGKYRAFTDPEIIDALLLQHLGIGWQVKFKTTFRSLLESKAWKRAFDPPTGKERERRAKQLTSHDPDESIESHRHRVRKQHFFLSQLSDAPHRPSTYDDLLDAPWANEDETDENAVLTPAAVKQKLLHIMATENHLNKTLYECHAVIRSDFQWFGPSLPHQSILTVLEFFGMPRRWLTFMKTFLEAPLRFKEDPEGIVRTRKRGTPISYALSVVCGEVIMFAMDFAVNQRAGLFLYRMHDDLWIWDKDPEKCAVAWREMEKYATVVGITFNMDKTGSACVGEHRNKGLPKGNVRWGFLVFDEAEGRFKIDQKDVDYHIKEMRRQLDATKSVFGWVNLYNKYMAFFLRNFGGKLARCSGMAHLEDTTETLIRIQTTLFADVEGGAVGYLRNVIAKKFGVQGLPTGYFYLPIGSGGLDLVDPMVELSALEKLQENAGENIFVKQKKHTDAETYQFAKQSWEMSTDSAGDKAEPIPFMSWDEYISLRESWLADWGRSYVAMLKRLDTVDMSPSPAVKWDFDSGGDSWGSGWDDVPKYKKWILALYGDELLKKFGSLEVVDKNLIPVGMVEVFKTSRMKLDE